MMGFFDSYQDLGGGGTFVGAAEKQQLIDNGVAFDIVKLALDADNQYGPRYVAFCQIPDLESGEPTERKISFPQGSGAQSRDDMLAQMQRYLAEDDSEPVRVKLHKPGRAILIQAA